MKLKTSDRKKFRVSNKVKKVSSSERFRLSSLANWSFKITISGFFTRVGFISSLKISGNFE